MLETRPAPAPAIMLWYMCGMLGVCRWPSARFLPLAIAVRGASWISRSCAMADDSAGLSSLRAVCDILARETLAMCRRRSDLPFCRRDVSGQSKKINDYQNSITIYEPSTGIEPGSIMLSPSRVISSPKRSASPGRKRNTGSNPRWSDDCPRMTARGECVSGALTVFLVSTGRNGECVQRQNSTGRGRHQVARAKKFGLKQLLQPDETQVTCMYVSVSRPCQLSRLQFETANH